MERQVTFSIPTPTLDEIRARAAKVERCRCDHEVLVKRMSAADPASIAAAFRAEHRLRWYDKTKLHRRKKLFLRAFEKMCANRKAYHKSKRIVDKMASKLLNANVEIDGGTSEIHAAQVHARDEPVDVDAERERTAVP